jgi:hypothetical protein
MSLSETSSQEISRRTLLIRGTLIAGCALCIPALWGCQKKETTGQEQTAPAAGPAPSKAKSESGEATKSVKLTQDQAQYQNQPKGDQKCENCMHFIAESYTCDVVQGEVSPDGWCTLWAKKAA